jgi:hypothetical protein
MTASLNKAQTNSIAKGRRKGQKEGREDE